MKSDQEFQNGEVKVMSENGAGDGEGVGAGDNNAVTLTSMTLLSLAKYWNNETAINIPIPKYLQFC